MDWSKRITPERRSIVLGCIGALIMGLVSCCAFSAIATGPAFGGSVPAPPEADPSRTDITMLIYEQFMNRALLEALPENIPVKGEMDVQPGNRLVFDGEFTLLLVKVPTVITLYIGFEGDELQIRLESMEAAGYDLTELTGMDASALTGAMSGPLQDQIEAGLGPGAQILGITTDDSSLIITARWAE
jgi:hypothetical protein